MNPPIGFLMTVDQALEFYKRCEERKAVSYEERMLILEEMQKERRVFPQTEEQLAKRMKGKRVLKVKTKEAPNGL